MRFKRLSVQGEGGEQCLSHTERRVQQISSMFLFRFFKILKNNLKTEIRVAQLGGYVSEKSAYHHGETSLYGTIINMAQDYVGSNNINLLAPNGMFGSRIRGGKDSASPRFEHFILFYYHFI